MNEIELLKERVLKLEQSLLGIKRARSGLMVQPTKNVLGQDTYINGSLYLNNSQVYQLITPGHPDWVGTANFPLTSTSWDGDSFSTTSKTLIDLSAVFGVPAGVKAVTLNVAIRDSASAANDCILFLGSNNTTNVGMVVRCSGQTNDSWSSAGLIVPCDANGDIYYQVVASGVGTMDIHIQVYGYWI